MPGGKRKSTLRQCTVCKKIGHNRSTCPERVLGSSPAAPTVTPPQSNPAHLKFFVHHTNTQPTESLHRVNLREHQNNPWSSVQSAAPKQPSNPNYFFGVPNEPPRLDPEKMTGEDAATNFLTPPPPGPVDIIFESVGPLEHIQNTFVRSWEQIKKFGGRARRSKTVLSVPVAPAPIVQEPEKSRLGGAFSWHRVARTLAIVAIAVFLLTGCAAGSIYMSRAYQFAVSVKADATESVAALLSAGQAAKNLDFSLAATQNTAARLLIERALSKTQNNFSGLQTVATALPILGTRVTDAKRLALALYQITLGNQELLSAYAAATPTTTAGEKGLLLATASGKALDRYTAALTTISTVHPDSLPAGLQAPFEKMRPLIETTAADIGSLHQLAQIVPDLFGGEGRRRYLIMFQNPAELRATGGFLGSYAFVELHDGNLTTFNVPAGGTYDVQGQLSAFTVPPAPLLMTNRRFELQDANWFPDWPTSAKKIDWFYRHSRGVSVDGVIAVNATLLPRILSLLGPVADTTRGVTFDAGSVLSSLQTLVESGPEKSVGKPKAVIGDLATTLGGRILTTTSTSDLLGLARVLNNALTEKDIQIALFDEKKAATLRELGWDGSLATTGPNDDYLLVTATNIAGGKSDARMHQSVTHQAVINADGTVDDIVRIVRSHSGSADEPLYGNTNIAYMRVYVPSGSTLVTASGFSWPDEQSFRSPLPQARPDQDVADGERSVALDSGSGTETFATLGKTAFANWMITEPGTTSTAILRYRLPFRLAVGESQNFGRWIAKIFGTEPTVPYQLIVDSQSGLASSFDSSVIFPGSFVTRWVGGAGATPAKNGMTIATTPLLTNSVFSLVMQKI